jgi:hypothetical protein
MPCNPVTLCRDLRRAVRSRERRDEGHDEGHATAINDGCCTKSEHEEGGPAISFHASRSN